MVVGDEGVGGKGQQDFRPRCMVQVHHPERPAAPAGFNSAQTTLVKVMCASKARNPTPTPPPLHPPPSSHPLSLFLSQDDHKAFIRHAGDTKVALVL